MRLMFSVTAIGKTCPNNNVRVDKGERYLDARTSGDGLAYVRQPNTMVWPDRSTKQNNGERLEACGGPAAKARHGPAGELPLLGFLT